MKLKSNRLMKCFYNYKPDFNNFQKNKKIKQYLKMF